MPDSAQKLWQIAFAGEIIKAQCFATLLKVYAVAATSLLRWHSLCMSAYGCRSRGCWVPLLSWDMTPGRFVWYVLSTSLQKCNALASRILAARSFFWVAFCPDVHFWSGILSGGILSGVVFVCGILSRGIMSGIRASYPAYVANVTLTGSAQ